MDKKETKEPIKKAQKEIKKAKYKLLKEYKNTTKSFLKGEYIDLVEGSQAYHSLIKKGFIK